MRGKELRLRRFLRKGRAVIVPMDHTVYYGPIPGVVDPGQLVRDVASTDADGILITLATLGRVAHDVGQLATVARLDGTHTQLGSHLSELDRISSVEYAVSCGAEACALNVYVGADNERDLLRKLGETAEDCEQWGLPLIGEMVPIGALAGHYETAGKAISQEELAGQIALASRVGAEVGADIIKTSYTGSVESFARVVQGASVPVVVAGGPCGDSLDGLLQMVEDCMTAGAMGVCIGRNVWKRENRTRVLTAICRIVHDGVPAGDALP